jgi:hypothetical protein
MIGEVWIMDYDNEFVMVIHVGERKTNWGTKIEFVVVLDSKGKKHSYSKKYFRTIAKKLEDKKCP